MPPKTEAIARLRHQLTELGKVPVSLSDRSGAFERWQRASRVAVEHTFGDASKHAQEFGGVNYHPIITTQNTTDEDRQISYTRGLKRAQLLLESFIDEIEEYWSEDVAQRNVSDEPKMADNDYDVCLSFAGEDRRYVESVAELLRLNGIRSFYDRHEEIELWGKDLYQHLDEIYRKRAQYCVLFISEAYAKKLWTKHELRSAQARAFEEHEEYILPARFDDTELPGVRRTVGYIDLRKKTPAEFAGLVSQKIRSSKHARVDPNRSWRVQPDSFSSITAGERSEPRPNVQPIRPWFTSVSMAVGGGLREETQAPLKALVAPFRNDPTPERPHVATASRLSATVWLEAISDFRVTGYWLNSQSPYISLAAGEQWLLVVAVVAPKIASLVADGRTRDAGSVEFKHFWAAPTNVHETIAVVSIAADNVLLGQYRYRLKLTPPFSEIALLLD